MLGQVRGDAAQGVTLTVHVIQRQLYCKKCLAGAVAQDIIFLGGDSFAALEHPQIALAKAICGLVVKQVAVRLAQQRAFRPAKQLCEAVIHILVSARPVLDEDTGIDPVEDGLQPQLTQVETVQGLLMAAPLQDDHQQDEDTPRE